MIEIFLLNVMLKLREKQIKKKEDENMCCYLCLRIYLKKLKNIIQEKSVKFIAKFN